MKKEIKISRLSEVQPKFPLPGLKSLRVITKWREQSDRMMLSISTIDAGLEGDSVNPGQDEIMYVLKGDPVITWEGGRAELHPQMAIYIPDGTTYKYSSGPKKNQILAILSPPSE